MCSLYLLSSYEVVVWSQFCLDKILECTPETVFLMLSTEAKRVKWMFNPPDVVLIAAYFKQYR